VEEKRVKKKGERVLKNDYSKMSNITQKQVKIFFPFTESYSSKLTASIISKKSGIPQQTVSRQLNEAVKQNLVNYIIDGRNKLFYLNLGKESTKNILTIAESQKALYFGLKNKRIMIILNEILNLCDALIIFGSYASGKADKESDIDIVILNGKEEKIKKLMEKQPFKIHRQFATLNVFDKILKSGNALAIEIRNNHILFGNISKIISIFMRAQK